MVGKLGNRIIYILANNGIKKKLEGLYGAPINGMWDELDWMEENKKKQSNHCDFLLKIINHIMLY